MVEPRVVLAWASSFTPVRHRPLVSPIAHCPLSMNQVLQKTTSRRSTIVSAAQDSQRNHECSVHHLSRREALQRAFALTAFATLNPLSPNPASAICGDPDPFYAHFIDWDEGLTTAPDGRQIHYRLIGSRKKEVKAKKFPVLYIGDAGVSLASGETLELLGDTDRRVLLVDLLGVGYSDALPSAVSDLTRSDVVAKACDEIVTVLTGLKIVPKDTDKKQSIHVVAAGMGLEIAATLMERLARTETSPTNLNIVSVVAEGWAQLPMRREEDFTFALMQGERSCAVEAAQQGDISIARKLYKSSEGRNSSGFQPAILAISSAVPTLAMRTSELPAVSETYRGSFLSESVIDGTGRLAHLANTEKSLEVLDTFFAHIEDNGSAA